MTHAERVVGTFAAFGETRDAAMTAQPGHPGTAAGEYLVRIGLVSDVPDEPVIRRIEYVVQGDAQLDRAEVR